MKKLHALGLMIRTVNNPGWDVCFNYKDKEDWEKLKSDKNSQKHSFHKNGETALINPDWFFFRFNKKKFNSAGGPLYLSLLFKAFEQWRSGSLIQVNGENNTLNTKHPKNMDNLEWLQWYYFSICDGDWERGWGMRINATKIGWELTISIEDTIYEDKFFDSFKYNGATKDYICSIERRIFDDKRQLTSLSFYGKGDPESLEDMIGVFRKWVTDINIKEGIKEVPIGNKRIDSWEGYEPGDVRPAEPHELPQSYKK